MELDQIKSALKEIITKDLDVNVMPEDIKDDVSLYEDGIGLDSISVVNFIVLIEGRFGLSFEDDQINTKMFSSINSLAGHIAAMRMQR